MATAGETRRDGYRALADRIRAIPGRDFGLRPYTVSVVLRYHSGENAGDGDAVDVATPLEVGGQPPKVRFANDEERALGNLPAGSLDVGPITPEHVSPGTAGGGLAWDVITGAAAIAGTEVLYLVTGPEFPGGALYAKVGGDSARGLRYTLRLAPRQLVP